MVPSHPFKSSLTACRRAMSPPPTTASGKQWTQPIGFIHALFEVAVEVLKRSERSAIRTRWSKAIAATKLDTVVGQVEWEGANLPPFAAKNIAKTRSSAGSGGSRKATTTTA